MLWMKTTDKIMAPSRGSYVTWSAYVSQFPLARLKYVLAYGYFTYRWAPCVGVDASIALSQSHVETFNLDTNCPYDSEWVRKTGNMVGMGITGDPVQDAASHDFSDDPEGMAKAHLAHLSLYATGDVVAPLTSADDVRYDAYRKTFGEKGVAPTIEGLNGNWAYQDYSYADKIVKRSTIIWPLGMEPTLTYATPEPMTNVDGSRWTGDKDIIVNDTIVYAQKRTVLAKKGGQARVNGSFSGAPTRAPFTEGETFQALGFFRAGADDAGEDRFWVAEDGSRVFVGETVDKPLYITSS